MWNNIKIIQKIKSMIPLRLKLILIKTLVLIQYIYYTIIPKKVLEIEKDKKRIFILLSTDYSNLGDHAMTYTHIKMLKEKFPQTQIVEILVGDTLKTIKYILSIIEPNDVITLKGGGNVGFEYFREELYRRIIIKKFSNNRIILFPQTIYFPNTAKGKKELSNTINLFKNHPKFYGFFRDKISYNMVKDELKERAFLVPDIVLYLSNLESENKRREITICLRNDKEGIYNKDQKNMIKQIAIKLSKNIRIIDTVTDYPIPKEQRERELYKIWNTFSSSRLIITDRLHGMIFAAITSTPCIVLGTYNHKLLGQFEWLKDLNYIKFMTCEKKELELAIKELINVEVVPYVALKYDKLFNNLISVIE